MGFGAGRHPDRLLAFGAVVIAAGVFAVLLARSSAPEPAPQPPDPVAAQEMLTLMRAGENLRTVVTYDFTRRGAGTAARSSQVSEAQLGGMHATRSGAVLDVRTPTATYHCQIVDDEPNCTKQQSQPALKPSEVFAAAIGTRAYGVNREPDATIAGERARCFRTRSINGEPYLSDLGTETLACFAHDGVVLRNQVAQPNPIDELVATRVQRKADPAALAPLLAGFDKDPTGVGG